MSKSEQNTNKWTEKHFGIDDLCCHIRARLVTEVVVEYEVRELFSIGDDGVLVFCKSSKDCGYTKNVDESEPMFRGEVKWDGCSDNEFTPYYHACGRYTITRIGTIFGHVYDMAAELMPGHDEYLREQA